MISRLRTAAKAFGGTVILTSIVVTGLIVGARQIGLLEGLELSAFDSLVRSRPDEGTDPRLLVVGVSETDIQTRKEYPITDATLAQVLEKLQQHQPRVIGIDIARDVPQGKGREALVKILTEGENIVAACKLSSANDPGTAAAPGVPQEQIGFADLPIDPGGTLRRSQLVSVPLPFNKPLTNQHLCNIPDSENQIPSFSYLLSLIYLESENIAQELTPSGDLKVGSTIFKRLPKDAGGYHNADVGSYQTILNYRSANNSVPQVTLSDVLEDKIDPALVKDKIVLIGYTAALVKDDFLTPYSAGLRDNQNMPGVVVHAQNVSQILSAVLNERPLIWYWDGWMEILWISGWSLVGGILAWRIRRPLLLAIAGAVAVGILYGSCYLLFLRSGWIPLVPAALALAVTITGVVLLDRGYAKTIVKGVTGFLKINIDIDQEKKERDIAQLSEEIDLDDLREKAKAARAEREKKRTSQGEGKASELVSETETAAPIDTPATEASEDTDYLGSLRQKGKTLRSREHTEPTEDSSTLEVKIDSPATESSEETDYLSGLRKKGRNLRSREPETSTESVPELISEIEAIAQPQPATVEPSEEADYLGSLRKKAQTFKSRETSVSTNQDSELKVETETLPQPPQTAEVSEVVDYFQQFQNQRQQPMAATPEQDLSLGTGLVEELDYFQQFQQKMQEGRHLETAAPEMEETSQPSMLEEVDYFQQFQQKRQDESKLDNTKAIAHVFEPPPETETSIQSPLGSQETEEVDYFEQLQKKAKKYKPSGDESQQ